MKKIYALFIMVMAYSMVSYAASDLWENVTDWKDIQQLQNCLHKKASLGPSQDGWSPLDIALIYGNEDSVKFLLDNGADINAKDDSGQNALHHALDNSRVEIAKLLISRGIDIIGVGNRSIFSYLRRLSPADVATVGKQLLEAGIDPNVQNWRGNTALHEAVSQGNIEWIKLLLAYGARLNIKNNDGETPFLYAVAYSNAKVAELLLDNGSDINTRNARGDSGLDIALKTNFASSDMLDTAYFLIRRSIDCTPSNLDFQETNGNTPLHNAVMLGKTEFIKLLLEHGANPNIKNNAGEIPLALASAGKFKNYQESEKILFPYTRNAYFHWIKTAILNVELFPDED